VCHTVSRLRRALPAKTLEEYEQRRAIVERARDEERLAERGEWVLNRSADDEAKHVSELMQIIRMRHIDVTAAVQKVVPAGRSPSPCITSYLVGRGPLSLSLSLSAGGGPRKATLEQPVACDEQGDRTTAKAERRDGSVQVVLRVAGPFARLGSGRYD
jgi:hypothetical protein